VAPPSRVSSSARSHLEFTSGSLVCSIFPLFKAPLKSLKPTHICFIMHMVDCNLGPCFTCKEIEAVDHQIERLLEQRSRLQSSRNAFHDPFILRLPLELASHIFLFCLPTEDRQVHSHQQRTQFILSWVCKGKHAPPFITDSYCLH